MQEPSESPLPSPNDMQCFHCGKHLVTHAMFCPHCGAQLIEEASPFLELLRAIGANGLAGLALLFGSCGACFMLVSSGPGGFTADALGLGFGLIGIFLLGLTALCIWGVISIIKKR